MELSIFKELRMKGMGYIRETVLLEDELTKVESIFEFTNQIILLR
jgi:hypothetical protein